VIVCDGDDYYTDSNYLKDVAELINKIPNLVMIQAGHLKGTDPGNATLCMPDMEGNSLLFNKFEYLEYYRKHAFFSHMSTVGKLEYLRKIDPYRLPVLSSDTETYLRLAYYGDVLLLKRAIGLWRQHAGNATATASIADSINNLQWIHSVSGFWVNKSKGILKIKAKHWGQEYLQYWFSFLFDTLLRSSSMNKKDVFKIVLKSVKNRSLLIIFCKKRNISKLIKYFLKN
jgi:hypothetical protein